MQPDTEGGDCEWVGGCQYDSEDNCNPERFQRELAGECETDNCYPEWIPDENRLIIERMRHPDVHATKENVRKWMKALSGNAKEGDSISFYYHGGGKQQKLRDIVRVGGDKLSDARCTGEPGSDKNKKHELPAQETECRGKECFIPAEIDDDTLHATVTCLDAKMIDTEIFDDLVKPITAKNVAMFCMFDACSSGTIMNLPYYAPSKSKYEMVGKESAKDNLQICKDKTTNGVRIICLGAFLGVVGDPYYSGSATKPFLKNLDSPLIDHVRTPWLGKNPRRMHTLSEKAPLHLNLKDFLENTTWREKKTSEEN